MLKVLVADDDDDQRYLVSRVLQRAGYLTIPVQNGADVVKVAREEAPALILLDVQMPDQDGWQTGRELKSDPETREVPIVFLTGRLDPRDRAIALELGAADCLAKSRDWREVVSCVQRLTATAASAAE